MTLLSGNEWRTSFRHEDGDLTLRHVSEECIPDPLHWTAKTGREQNTGAALSLIEDSH